jgi:putative oxidoreductase
MTVAVVTVHRGNGLLATSNGSELPLLYATVAAVVALAGPGPASLDAVLGIAPVWSPELVGVILAAGVLAGVGNTLARRPPAPRRA